MVERRLYSYKEAGVLCDCSSKSIQRAVARGELRAIPCPGTSSSQGLRISMREIDRYIQEAEKAVPTMEQWKKARDANEKKRKGEIA